MIDNPGKTITGGVCAAQGFKTHAVQCGIKDPKAPRLDMGLIYSDAEEVTSCGVFTSNRIKAAPVKVSQNHLKASQVKAFLVNSGNANACTGVAGIEDAKLSAKEVAQSLGINMRQVAVCSTGVIGLPLPIERMVAKLPDLVAGLKEGEAQADLFAKSIMTSDTRQKECAIEIELNGQPVRIGGCAKGAGMIKPSMATMLSFITTDVCISKEHLQKCLLEATEKSFNRISIDGDMSTNDTALVMANGASGVEVGLRNGENCRKFCQGLIYVMDQLARQIVLDGEKVTKFITLKVKNARSYLDAKKVAEAVADSPLVKSAWNGDDPNWGRVIHAVGYARASIREELIDIYWDQELACKGGILGPAQIGKLREIAAKEAFELTIDLNLEESDYTMYTSDLSPEYVDYNRSEYSYWKAVERNQG